MNFRLSFYERMRDIVPIDFEPLLPEKPEPKFKYAIEKSSKILVTLKFCIIIELLFFIPQIYLVSSYQIRS